LYFTILGLPWIFLIKVLCRNPCMQSRWFKGKLLKIQCRQGNWVWICLKIITLSWFYTVKWKDKNVIVCQIFHLKDISSRFSFTRIKAIRSLSSFKWMVREKWYAKTVFRYFRRLIFRCLQLFNYALLHRYVWQIRKDVVLSIVKHIY
jgi:hypothetical protein